MSGRRQPPISPTGSNGGSRAGWNATGCSLHELRRHLRAGAPVPCSPGGIVLRKRTAGLCGAPGASKRKTG